MQAYPILPPSPHFSWAEAEITNHRNIDNSIPRALWNTIRHTAERMEYIRALLGKPITVNSWYRCRELNIAIGSNPDTTQHAKGEAVDFICPAFGSPEDICKKIITYKDIANFDQLIFEHTWVHISFIDSSDPSKKPRKQVLTLLKSKKYATGLTDKNGVPL